MSYCPACNSKLEEVKASLGIFLECTNGVCNYSRRINKPGLGKPKTEVVCPGIDQIPFEGIEAIGEIFNEGETKYGRDNWKTSPDDKEYNNERCRHAIRHLYKYANGDRSEPHLAKVAWFCVTTIWREKNK